MKYCEEFAALLDPYVDGELPPEETAKVRAHLAQCPGCQAYVQAALLMRDAFPDVEETEVPEGFAESVCAAIRAGAAPRTRRRRRWTRVVLPLAACCAIVLLARTVIPMTQGNSADGASQNLMIEAADMYDNAAQDPSADPEEDSGENTAPMARQEEAENEETAQDATSPSAYHATESDTSGKSLMTAAQSSYFAALTLTEEQVGTALDGYTPASRDQSGTYYELDAAAYNALLEQLAAAGVNTEASSADVDTEAGLALIYVLDS